MSGERGGRRSDRDSPHACASDLYVLGRAPCSLTAHGSGLPEPPPLHSHGVLNRPAPPPVALRRERSGPDTRSCGTTGQGELTALTPVALRSAIAATAGP